MANAVEADQSSSAGTDTVAVLGAGGTMGFAIARNLRRAGLRVRAWDRTRQKAEPLAEDGAVVLDTPAEAAETSSLSSEGLGLDPSLLLEAVEGGSLDTPYLRMKAKAIMTRNFEPSFRLALAAQDAALIEEAVEARGLELPLATPAC